MNRVLIVRLGALGDVVHAIPVAAALRRAYPSARIDWLVSSRHREILDLVPVIDRRLAIHDRAGAGGSSWLAAIRELRSARYDVAIDLQGLIKSAVLARSSGAARVVGFSADYARERVARLFYTDAYDPGFGGLFDPRETRHIVEINLRVLEAIGITATGRPEFPLDRVESMPARKAAEITGGHYALLNPGAAWPNKRWPPDRLGAVAMDLRERHGLMSVVLWGPGEEDLAQAVVAASRGAAVVAERTRIADIVELARGAAVMVSGDTGPTHIASAVGTPLVGIYGPTRPSRNGPLAPDDISVSRDQVCQCHHLRRCKLDRMCLLDIEVADVVSALDRRLTAGRARA